MEKFRFSILYNYTISCVKIIDINIKQKKQLRNYVSPSGGATPGARNCGARRYITSNAST